MKIQNGLLHAEEDKRTILQEKIAHLKLVLRTLIYDTWRGVVRRPCYYDGKPVFNNSHIFIIAALEFIVSTDTVPYHVS